MGLDLASVLGTLFGVLALVGGQVLEGGSVGQIVQGTAALIVFGGTLGAVLLAYPPRDLRRAFSLIPSIYFQDTDDVRGVIDEIVELAAIARKEGILAVESRRQSIAHPLFKKTLKFVIDGFDPATVREIIDTEIETAFEEDESAARVFEGAGGFAPTIGILGAVLGLIHVMSLLNDPSKIGEGIAVAFVATLYGVGLANLILLPWSNKLKRRAQARTVIKEVVKLGVLGIQEGLNPNFLQEKLEVFLAENERRGREGEQPA